MTELKVAASNWLKARTELLQFLVNSERYMKKGKQNSMEVDDSNVRLKHLWTNLGGTEGVLIGAVKSIGEQND